MTFEDILLWIACYLVGNIPFSYLIARFVKRTDLRYDGEGNVGARNVWHTVSPAWGVTAAVLDVSKGVLAFLLARHFASGSLAFWLSGFAAVLGHDIPVVLKGRGGKGAATGMGFVLCVYPLPCLLTGATLALSLFLKKGFNVRIAVGMASLPLLWLPLFGVPVGEIAAVVLLMLTMGIKRILDTAHMHQARERSGWYWD